MTNAFDPYNPPRFCPSCAQEGVKSKVKKMKVDPRGEKFIIMCKNDQCPWPLSVMSVDEVTITQNGVVDAVTGEKVDAGEASVTDPVKSMCALVAAEDSYPVVPQVKVGENGELVLDESSLFIKTKSQSESLDSTNTSWRKKTSHKGWSKKETIKFYKALTACGSDFSMIEFLFKNRDRKEIKRKFKREERVNGHIVDRCLNSFINDKGMCTDLDILISDSTEDAKEEGKWGHKSKKKRPRKRYRNKGYYDSSEDEDRNADILTRKSPASQTNRVEIQEDIQMKKIMRPKGLHRYRLITKSKERLVKSVGEASEPNVSQIVANGGTQGMSVSSTHLKEDEESKGGKLNDSSRIEICFEKGLYNPNRHNNDEEFAPLKLGVAGGLDTKKRCVEESSDVLLQESIRDLLQCCSTLPISLAKANEIADTNDENVSMEEYVYMDEVGEAKVEDVEYVPSEQELREDLEGLVFGGYLPKVMRELTPPRTGLSERIKGRGGRNEEFLCEKHMMGAVDYMKNNAERRGNQTNPPPQFKTSGCKKLTCNKTNVKDDTEYKPPYKKPLSSVCQNQRRLTRFQKKLSHFDCMKFSVAESYEEGNINESSLSQIEDIAFVPKQPRAQVNENYLRKKTFGLEKYFGETCTSSKPSENFDKTHISSKPSEKFTKFDQMLKRRAEKKVTGVASDEEEVNKKRTCSPNSKQCSDDNRIVQTSGLSELSLTDVKGENVDVNASKDNVDELLDDLDGMIDGNNNEQEGYKLTQGDPIKTEYVRKEELSSSEDPNIFTYDDIIIKFEFED